jgi:hypothetical protein
VESGFHSVPAVLARPIVMPMVPAWHEPDSQGTWCPAAPH